MKKEKRAKRIAIHFMDALWILLFVMAFVNDWKVALVCLVALVIFFIRLYCMAKLNDMIEGMSLLIHKAKEKIKEDNPT